MKQKILAIDDSLILRELIKRSLARQSTNYDILLAKDGNEGLTLAASEQPDLILLDFILPDLKGDEVCRQLQSNQITAGLPVVLLSSSAVDIKRTQGEFENVVHAIAKPFTPDLLCATVAQALRETGGRIPGALPTTPAQARPVSPAKPAAAPAAILAALPPAEPKLAGDTVQFSLISVLQALEQDRLTGRLCLSSGPGKPLELHIAAGRPVLVTLRDPAQYLRNSDHKLTLEQIQAAGKFGLEQARSGAPIFLQFAQEKLMPADTAISQCQLLGLRLFAPLWTAPRTQFSFEPNHPLPPGCSYLPAYTGTMMQWAMESLRLVGEHLRSDLPWAEPTGIPAYTRKGFERIQQLQLTASERAFAEFIQPTHSLAAIAAAMKVEVAHAQRILHQFLRLEILDSWPAHLLQNPAQPESKSAPPNNPPPLTKPLGPPPVPRPCALPAHTR